MAEFFVVVPPGWEDELGRELREIEPFLIGPSGWPDPKGFGEIETVPGGATLRCDPLAALQVHFHSRLASRVLQRLKRFHAAEFHQLEKGLRAIPVREILGGSGFALKAEARKSRINNEKRILEIARRVWGPEAPEGGSRRTLYLRNDGDEVSVSLDLTGEHLHRRSTGRELGGPAPIRETLAAHLLRFLIDGEPLSVLRETVLVDPMAGSGTLMSEAAFLYRPRRVREFAFDSLPGTPKILKSESFMANHRRSPDRLWKRLVAFDSFEAARERLRALAPALAPHEFEVRDSVLSGAEPALSLRSGDMKGIPNPADLATESTDRERRWVVANPPYGERLRQIPTEELREILLASGPERVAVILPEKLALDLKRAWPRDWNVRRRPVLNGGIRCFLLVFEKSSTAPSSGVFPGLD